jgi:hypothetical protein
MTPLKAAKAHCANYQQDGSCLGIYHKNDLSVDHSKYRPCAKCLLADDKRCEYFEEIILPMRLERPAEATSLASAVSAYQRQHRLQALWRLCPKCGETPLQARERLCAGCRAKHRRQTHQKYNSHRKRQIGPLTTTVNGFST